MGRKSLKEVRQKEIILAFYTVSKREGLENSSISKVAKEMDINPSLVMHYFNTKEDLVFGLIHFILERYKSIFTSDVSTDNIRAKLLNIVNNLFSKKWNTFIDDSVFYSCFALIFRSEKIKEEFKKMQEHLREELSLAIQEGIDNDIIHIDTTSHEAADLIYNLLAGSYLYLSLYDDTKESNKKLEFYKENALQILNLEAVN